MRMLAAHIPNCQFVTVPEAGHAAFWEQPETWNRLVLELGQHYWREGRRRGETRRRGSPCLLSSPVSPSPLPYGLQTARHLPELKTPAVST